MKYHLGLWLSLPCFAMACTAPPAGPPDNRTLAAEALELAGANRPELKQVIAHYQSTDPDAEKLEATYFLIAHMPGKYTLTASNIAPYRAALKRIAQTADPSSADHYLSISRRMLDSLQRAEPLRPIYLPDIEHVRADFLMASIDSAFSRWRSAPWKERYSFEDFCEWVLPYRTTHEEPEDWRALALARRPEHEADRQGSDSLFQLAVLLINHTGQRYGVGTGSYPLPMTFGDMNLAKEGACNELTEYATKLFRSRGIPAAMDLIPAWGNRSSSHAWNSIIGPNKTSRGIGYHPSGKLEVLARLPKVYRRRYSTAREELLYLYRNQEPIPPFFRAHDLLDVTAQYIETSEVEVRRLKPSDTKLVWLGCFNNSTWVPVAYARKRGSKALFKAMGRGTLMYDNRPTPYKNGGKGILYLPLYYDGNTVRAAADPLILQEDGRQISLKIDREKRQRITVSRKYPKSPSFEWYDSMMLGGRFEGASRADFSDAVLLHEITAQQPHYFTPYALGQPAAYRYVRYVIPRRDTAQDIPPRYAPFIWAKHNEGNVAELRFYAHGELLIGRPIGTPGNHAKRGPAAAFDGDMESFYATSHSHGVEARAWLGLDLGEPRTITALAYRARNDDNDVRPGDTYRLFYWDDGWQGLDSQRATDYTLTWRDVPCGTLYLLRNLTRGVEQRPFTYQNDRITWW